MLIKTRKKSEIKECEVTPQTLFEQRRLFIKKAVGYSVAAAGFSLPATALAALKINPFQKDSVSLRGELTAKKHVTSYNNFYEFGTDKKDPAKNAASLKTDPWSVTVEGECDKPGVYALEDLVKPHPFEERIYRLRCVEAWSMVIPWIGFPLADLIKQMQPNSKAKYVEFTTLNDPEQMPGQKRSVLDWPYVEALRMDEAMNPLSLMAVGLYGEVLPNQNGAPLRLVLPWKYGFKSIKSIVKIRFSESQPQTTWNLSGPKEYGFYANVNPEVDHPRWSQSRERRIGEFRKRKTEMFNGYAEEVAHLYSGMDLKRNF